MNYSLYKPEERADRIEQKVIEQATFADDELESYVNYLQTIKSEIKDISDQIKYIDDQDLLHNNRIESERIHQTLQKKLFLIHEDSIHQSKLRKINFDHSQKVSAMVADFDDLINNVSQWSDQMSKKKISEIDKQIESAKKKLNFLQNKNQVIRSSFVDDDEITIDELNGSNDELDESDQQLQTNRIQELENQIERKKKEKSSEFESVKKKLEKCLAMIDSMTRKNKKEKDELIKKLKSNDEVFANKLAKVNRNYQREIDDLKIKVQSSEKTVKQILEEIEIKSREFYKKMSALKKESDLTKSEIKSLNQNANLISSSVNEKSQSALRLEEILIQKKNEYEQKMNLLSSEIETNTALKRELNLKKIDQKLEMRRESRK